jgi:hypothetical protein
MLSLRLASNPCSQSTDDLLQKIEMFISIDLPVVPDLASLQELLESLATSSTEYVNVLNELASFFASQRDTKVWSALLVSPFFAELLPTELASSDTDPDYRTAAISCIMSLFQAAQRFPNPDVKAALTRSPVFAYIIRHGVRRFRECPINPVLVFCSVLSILDWSFVEVVKFIALSSGKGGINKTLVSTIPLVIESFLLCRPMERHGHLYKPRIWLFRAFIRYELYPHRDIHRFPNEDHIPFSKAAIAALTGWYQLNASYDPVPLLESLGPTVLFCFGLGLNEVPYDIKCNAMRLMVDLLANVWPIEEFPECREVFDRLSGTVIAWIYDDYGAMSEVASSFFIFLINYYNHWNQEIGFDWIPDKLDRVFVCAVALRHPNDDIKIDAMESLFNVLETLIENGSDLLGTFDATIVMRNVMQAISEQTGPLVTTGLHVCAQLIDLEQNRTLPRRFEWPSILIDPLKFVFSCAYALKETNLDTKITTMVILIRLTQPVWLEIPRETLISILDILAPVLMNVISTRQIPNENALVEAALDFFTLFIQDTVSRHCDLSDFKWLLEPEHIVVCCLAALSQEKCDLKHTALKLVINLLEHLWFVVPDVILRLILDTLAQGVIQVIMGHNQRLVEAGLCFFTLFIDKNVYQDDDLSAFQWLWDLPSLEYGRSSEFHCQLVNYWQATVAPFPSDSDLVAEDRLW